MPRLPRYMIVYDFETGGIDPNFHEVIQVAGKAYDFRTLKEVPGEQGEFESLMKPLHFDRLEDGALKVNGKTREQLEQAPDTALVWREFQKWVGNFNPKKNKWEAPIRAGKNIRNFDDKFTDILNKAHLKGSNLLFSTHYSIDMDDLLLHWFSASNLPNFKMDTIRDYMGMSTDNAHDALVDVRQTGAFIMRFIKFYRTQFPKMNFEGCFAGSGI